MHIISPHFVERMRAEEPKDAKREGRGVGDRLDIVYVGVSACTACPSGTYFGPKGSTSLQLVRADVTSDCSP